MNSTPKSIIMLAQPSSGLTRAIPSASHQGGGEKCATFETTIHGRELTTTATWNVRTLAQTGKLQELTYELERYTWHMNEWIY